MCQECAALAVCDRCENEVDGEELREIAGENVCESCADDAHTCEHCDSVTWDDCHDVDGQSCCNSCWEDAPRCDRCNCDTWETRDVDGCDWCERCVENHAYYWESDEEYHTEPDPRGPIFDRHDRRGTRMPGATSGNYVGVELEVIPNGDRDYLAEEVTGLCGLHCEEDSSLDDDGFEIVTDYGEIDQVLRLCGRIADTVDGEAKSHDTDCCGLHVHLSRNGCTQYEIARLVIFWNSPANLLFLRRFSRRKPNAYCKVKDVNGKSEAELASAKDRYEVINVTNARTLEIRAFRGTTRKSTLLACVQLAFLSWVFAKDHSIPDTELTSTRFVEWVQKRTDAEHVIAYLKMKGMIRCA